MSARADRLLGERQSITDSKKFRAAKKKLGIISRRDGFGRGGEWFWELPTTSKTKAIETALDPATKKAAMVVYAETHSRPDDLMLQPDIAVTRPVEVGILLSSLANHSRRDPCPPGVGQRRCSSQLRPSTASWHVQPEYPAGRPENPRQSFPS